MAGYYLPKNFGEAILMPGKIFSCSNKEFKSIKDIV